MVTKTKERPPKSGLPERLVNKEEPEDEGDLRLVEDWEASPAEELGAAIESEVLTSQRVARIKNRIIVLRLQAKGSRKKDAKDITKEVNKISIDELTPALDELETHTWNVIQVLVDHPETRDRIENWRVMRPNLRKRVARGLKTKDITVKDMLDKVDALEAEAEGAAEE